MGALMDALVFLIAAFLGSQSDCQRVPYSYFTSLDKPAMQTLQVILTPTPHDPVAPAPVSTIYLACFDDSLAVRLLIQCGSPYLKDDYWTEMPGTGYPFTIWNPRMVKVSPAELKAVIDAVAVLEEVTDGGVDEHLQLHIIKDNLGRVEGVGGNSKPPLVMAFQILDLNDPRYFGSDLNSVTAHSLVTQILATLDEGSPERELIRQFGSELVQPRQPD